MINYSLIIFAFLIGWFGHKKKDSILTFVRSLKFFLKSYSKKNQKYNEFFECNFNTEDYSNIEKGDDLKNV